MYSLGNSTSRCNMANNRFIKRGLYLKKGRKVISRSSRFGRRFRPMSAPMSSLSRVMVKQCLPTSHLEVHLFIYEQRYDYSCALSFIHAHNILFVYRYTCYKLILERLWMRYLILLSVGFAFLLLARHNLSELWILLLLRSSVVVVFRVLFAFLGAWWHGDERNDFRRDR